jgi:hypothetical protein
MSLNQTFMRSVNTSLVVLLPILSLLLFGGDTLKDFAFALFVGVLSGTYSSIFVASPILTVLKEREPRFQAVRAKAEQRAGGQAAKSRKEPVAAGAAADAAVGAAVSASSKSPSKAGRAVSSSPSSSSTATRANLPASVTQPRKTKKSTAKKRRKR